MSKKIGEYSPLIQITHRLTLSETENFLRSDSTNTPFTILKNNFEVVTTKHCLQQFLLVCPF